MPGPPALRLPPKGFLAIVLLGVFALFLAAWGTLALETRGYDRDYAQNLVRLLVLPFFAVLCWLIVRDRRRFLERLWTIRALSLRAATAAVAIGILARILSWSGNFAGLAFGWKSDAATTFVSPLSITYDCPPAMVVTVGIIVWWVVVPLTEEFVHRGLLMSALLHKGPVVAIGVSTLIFACAHAPSNVYLPLAFGVIFGIQYWNTKTVWAPVISHATYDGLIPFDTYCLDVRWQPDSSDLPLAGTAMIATSISLACVVLITWLLLSTGPGSRATRPLDLTN